MPMAVISKGGVRGEEKFFMDLDPHQRGEQGARILLSTDDLLPALLAELRKDVVSDSAGPRMAELESKSGLFKDMLS